MKLRAYKNGGKYKVAVLLEALSPRMSLIRINREEKRVRSSSLSEIVFCNHRNEAENEKKN